MDPPHALNAAVHGGRAARAAVLKTLADLVLAHKEELLTAGAFGVVVFLGRCRVCGAREAAAGAKLRF